MNTSSVELPDFNRIMKEDLEVYIKKNSPWSEESILWLIAKSLHSEPRLGFRIAWLIDHILEPDFRFGPEAERALVEGLLSTDNYSIARHFAKILALGQCSHEAIESLVDFSFHQLTNPEVPVAVKAHLLGIAQQACAFYPELIPELRSTMEVMEPNASVGLRGRMRRCQKDLKRMANKNA